MKIQESYKSQNNLEKKKKRQRINTYLNSSLNYKTMLSKTDRQYRVDHKCRHDNITELWVQN